jgi:hypothetical protein
MSNATAQVHFTVIDDELSVSAPAELAPLTDFFETEIGTSEAMLDLITHHVRHDRTWRFTGNACALALSGETVTIEHLHTGARAVLTRAELRALLSELRALVAEN